ncbi:MAG: class I SAM-dependent methyltransferase [Pseudomonadota bacterium]
MSDRETLAVYADKARDYATKFTSLEPDETLRGFIAALPDNARVLDLGCGPGNAAAAMRNVGITVDAWDASPEMGEMAKAMFNIDVKVAAFEALQATSLYDGIYANFSLLHAPKSDMPAHLDRISKALKPTGIFHIGMKTGSGEQRDQLGRFYAYYEESELIELLEGVGLRAVRKSTGAEEGLDGTVAPWITILASK